MTSRTLRTRALLVTALVLPTFLIVPAPAAAQQAVPGARAGRIVGRVLDAESGAGLSDAGVQVVGTTIGTYIARCRVAEAQRLLITSDRTTAEIAHASGFTAQSSFYETFRQVCGVAPGDYRRTFR